MYFDFGIQKHMNEEFMQYDNLIKSTSKLFSVLLDVLYRKSLTFLNITHSYIYC